MKKVLFFILLGSLLFGSAKVLRAADLGVGAVADRLSNEKKRLVEGLGSPFAEITVVDPQNQDKLIAVAEIERSGKFKFEFGYPEIGLDKLEVFGADEFGLTSRVAMADFLSSTVLMPPTIVNDKADKGIKNLAVKGMAHPYSDIELTLVVQVDNSKSILKTKANEAGFWSITSMNLKPGKYVATAKAFNGDKVSRESQELYFEIALSEVPTGFNNFWQNFWSNLSVDPTWILILMMPFVWLHIRNWSGWSSLLGLLWIVWPLFGFKRRSKVGVVYDAISKQPVESALVVVKKFSDKKVVAIDITNNRGEFNFDLEAGEYLFDVKAGKYLFPSKLIKGKGSDGQYVGIYHGEKIILRQGDILSLSIPVDPVETTNQSLFALKNFLKRFGSLILSLWLLICIVWAFVLFVYYPDFLHILILCYYLLLLIYLFGYQRPMNPRSSVVKTTDGQPVPEVLVALYGWPRVELVATRVTNSDGEFAVHLDAGQYTIKLFDESYLLRSVDLAKDGIVTFKRKGWLKGRLVVDIK